MILLFQRLPLNVGQARANIFLSAFTYDRVRLTRLCVTSHVMILDVFTYKHVTLTFKLLDAELQRRDSRLHDLEPERLGLIPVVRVQSRLSVRLLFVRHARS